MRLQVRPINEWKYTSSAVKGLIFFQLKYPVNTTVIILYYCNFLFFFYGQIKPIPNKPNTKETSDGFALPSMPAPSSTKQKKQANNRSEGLLALSFPSYSVSGIKRNVVSSSKTSIYATNIEKNGLCIHKFIDCF